MRTFTILTVALGLGVAVGACKRMDDLTYDCTASFSPAGAPQKFVYEHVKTPESARDRCLGDAKKARPSGANQISCDCKSR